MYCCNNYKSNYNYCSCGLCNQHNVPCAPNGYDIRYSTTNLVSNVIGGAYQSDVDLINAWGSVIINNQLWVSAEATGLITSYDMNGNKLPTTVIVNDSQDIPALPTGIAHNPTSGFIISNGTISGPSTILIATNNGTVNAYNSTVNPTKSQVVVDNSKTGSVYKGIAVAGFYMYLANFSLNRIDVYDNAFRPITNFPFTDVSGSPVPSTYSPFNIVYLNGLLYVMYAQRNQIKTSEQIPGPGLGYVNVFNTNGTFIRRLISSSVLNAPWSIIHMPHPLGIISARPQGTFLISNTGDGTINMFDCDGNWLGRLVNQANVPIQIDGLWNLITSGASSRLIYFSAGPNNGLNGLVGYMTPTFLY